MAGCTPVDIPEAANSNVPGVKNLAWSAAGRDLTLSWELPTDIPAGLEMKAIEVVKNNQELTTIELCNSYLIKRAAVNTELSYAVRIRYVDSRAAEATEVVSPNAALVFTIDYEEKARPAMVLLAENVADLESDEEQGAARWFKEI